MLNTQKAQIFSIALHLLFSALLKIQSFCFGVPRAEFPWKSADDLLSTVGKSSCCASPRGGSGQVLCAGARVAWLEKQALGAESTPSKKTQPIKRWLIGKMHCIAIRNTCLHRRCPGAVAAAVPVTADG